MSTGGELEFPRTGGCNLREITARATLRRIRNQGHPYVELREDGKRFIFFCTLCLCPCYNESTLSDHLKGNLHRQRYTAAAVTLFGPTPWPFNDGVFFFHDLSEKERQLVVLAPPDDEILNADSTRLGTIVNCQDKTIKSNITGKRVLDGNESNKDSRYHDECSSGLVNKLSDTNNVNHDLVIPGVLINDEVSILGLRFLGVGHIAARIRQTDEISERISRIWCAWLGEEDSDDRDMFLAPDCDFAIINFSYTYDLGRKAVVNDMSLLPSSSPYEKIDNRGSTGKKRKEPTSEPEDMRQGLSVSCGSSGCDSLAASTSSEKALVLQKDAKGNAITTDRYDAQLMHSRFMLGKHARRELRRQQRLAAERNCDVCQQRMLPGKDVATLLNRKTGSLVCSSRNTNGAFHVFHVSCLIHWVLLCEFEIWNGQSTNGKIFSARNGHKPRRKRATNSKKTQMNNGSKVTKTHISSVFCPECQGTGMNIEGDQMEKPTIPLSEMFLYKIKAIESHKGWMRNPEILQKCSTGLHFPCGSEENLQEEVFPLKLLSFYQPVL